MAVAHDHEDLRDLVDRLTPDQARSLLQLIERKLATVAEKSVVADNSNEPEHHGLATAGIFDSGHGDLSERVEEVVERRFNRST